MGKATIASNLGKGQYTATVGRKTDRIETRISEIKSRLDKITDEILAQQAIILVNQSVLTAAMSSLHYIATSELTWREELIDITASLIIELGYVIDGAQQEIANLEGETAVLLAEKETIEDRIAEINALLITETNPSIIASLTLEREEKQARIVEIDYRIAEIEKEIKAQELLIQASQNAIQGEIAALQNLQNQADRTIEEKAKLMEAAVKLVARLASAIQGAERQISILKAEKASLLEEKERLEDEIEEQTLTVWCCDYSNRLTGDVGTIEVTTNGDKPIIVPGHPKGTLSVYDYAKHGILDPLYNAGVPNSLTAFCIEPGWRKWKPFYRTGTLTSKTANTGTVDLDSAWSDANRGLNVNQTGTLSNVPFEYMGIGSALFRVGDHIVVKFTDKDWNQPKIIGFVDHPRPPGWYEGFGPPYHTFNNNSAGVAPLIISGGNGMPVSGTMLYSGLFYDWTQNYQRYNAANVNLWDGSWLQVSGSPVYWVSAKSFITQDFHKLIVLMNAWEHNKTPREAYTGSGGLNLGNYPDYTPWAANGLLFPGDAVDFSINNQAVGTSDFLLADTAWNTLEITLEIAPDGDPYKPFNTISMFLYANLQSADTRLLSGTDVQSPYLFGAPGQYTPLGTLIEFGRSDETPPSLPYGNGELGGFVSMFNWDRGYWSNALDPPYTFNGIDYYPKATAGLRYFRYFKFESINGNIVTYTIKKPDINPEHDIKAIHFAGHGIVHSVRFYLDED